MKLKELSLRQFRNLHNVKLGFSEHINVFYGENGQGKTNLIEAIVFLSSARSFRVRNDKVLIQDNFEFGRIEAEMLSNGQDYSLLAVISQEGKYFEVNQQAIARLSDFIGYCNVVLFNPDDLNLFTTSPGVRRREFDYELGKLSKTYLQDLNRAQHLLKERNSYLKENEIDDLYLEILTNNLIDVSVSVMTSRNEFIAALNPVVNEYFKIISGMDIDISLQYESAVNLKENHFREELSRIYASSLQRDRQFGMTHRGFHREDIIFYMNGKPVSDVASQGQRRLIILAYKIALTKLIASLSGQYPILCLDDLFSELDAQRRYQVLKALPEDMQVFISTTDLSFLETNKPLRILEIKNGEVYQGG